MESGKTAEQATASLCADRTASEARRPEAASRAGGVSRAERGDDGSPTGAKPRRGFDAQHDSATGHVPLAGDAHASHPKFQQMKILVVNCDLDGSCIFSRKETSGEKMTRRAFYSFHYQPDNWRAAQVRSMGVIDGNKPASDNAWEDVKAGGDDAIQEWIDDQLAGKTVVIILIGQNTAGRKWINYEIKKAWRDKKGVLGIYIHNLKNSAGDQSEKGSNPFSKFTIDGVSMDEIVKTYNPPYSTSTNVYSHIKENLGDWIEKAIEIRGNYS